MSYRYKITGEDFEFDHEEKGGRRLEVGSIIKRSQGPDEYKVTKITKEARSMFGFAPPMLSSRGSAEAERFFRAQP